MIKPFIVGLSGAVLQPEEIRFISGGETGWVYPVSTQL